MSLFYSINNHYRKAPEIPYPIYQVHHGVTMVHKETNARAEVS